MKITDIKAHVEEVMGKTVCFIIRDNGRVFNLYSPGEFEMVVCCGIHFSPILKDQAVPHLSLENCVLSFVNGVPQIGISTSGTEHDIGYISQATVDDLNKIMIQAKHCLEHNIPACPASAIIDCGVPEFDLNAATISMIENDLNEVRERMRDLEGRMLSCSTNLGSIQRRKIEVESSPSRFINLEDVPDKGLVHARKIIGDKLHILTNRVIAEVYGTDEDPIPTVDLGRFHIILNLGILFNISDRNITSGIKFYNLDGYMRYDGGLHSHPHIIYGAESHNNGSIFTSACFGAATQAIAESLRQSNIGSMVNAVLNFLTTIDARDSAGMSWRHWEDHETELNPSIYHPNYEATTS